MGQIISVHSFRGGTGKSNLVANLSVALAAQGKRIAVVDTDIQSPGIHVLFNLDLKQVNHTLNDYLLGRCSVEAPVFDVTQSLPPERSQVIPRRGGAIYLIPSSMKVDEITTILSEGYDIGLLTQAFQQLLQHLKLDYVLIDTHPGFNEETLLSIGLSDALVVILRTDQQDFQGTALTVRVAKRLNVPKLGLVVNKLLPDFNPQEVKTSMEKTFEAPVVGVLPLETDMIRLASRDLFYLKFPGHPLSQQIHHLADWLA
ncbi:MAG TPA: MinD/ParA family protein [Leptolyngbyaceae cyanobacterium M65_K2018_010]|nr:MinD/ParA family protein [Leptolyngbyaceae cyanobacterium M65_K2018_010]